MLVMESVPACEVTHVLPVGLEYHALLTKQTLLGVGGEGGEYVPVPGNHPVIGPDGGQLSLNYGRIHGWFVSNDQRPNELRSDKPDGTGGGSPAGDAVRVVVAVRGVKTS